MVTTRRIAPPAASMRRNDANDFATIDEFARQPIEPRI